MESKLFFIGNAHLDPVWLWQWQEGYAEIKATFRSALDRMKEFPDFVFTSACAAYYEWIEENAPDMFEEIAQRVREGRWALAGGWWIQPDCNLPCGESFARQALYSQRYFLEKFGKMAKVGYNVDSFGHNGMLPQILQKSGMDYYVFMRPGPHENDAIPYLFRWESMDGSQVLTFKIPFSYASWDWYEELSPEADGDFLKQKTLSTLELANSRAIDMMNFFGVGNHGGGPTIANVRLIHDMQRSLGQDVIRISSPDDYFEHVGKTAGEIPVFSDELQHHASGCYAAHSETKRSNRKAESRLLTAEKAAALAHGLLGAPYRKDELQRAWKCVLLNQFHDILGGCSIKEAYDDVRETYGEALNIGAHVLNDALQRMSWAIDTMGEQSLYLDKQDDSRIWEMNGRGVPLVVFNPHSWPVKTPVEVNKTAGKVTDDTGRPLDIQHVRGAHTLEKYDKWHTLFHAELPALGYRVYWIYRDKDKLPEKRGYGGDRNRYRLENEWMLVEIDSRTGCIATMYDKKHRMDVLASPGAVPVVLDESDCDTWAHGVFEFRNEIGAFADAQVEMLEDGPLRGTIRVTSRYRLSVLQQDFILYANSPDLEVRAKLDWRERHKMLKLSFPINVRDPKAIYEIPYGFIERPANGEEEPSQQWVDVSGCRAGGEEGMYGLSLLNDSKYSFDVKDCDLRMTVVRSPLFADHGDPRDEYGAYMDQGLQEFEYKLVPHTGRWCEAGVVKKAREWNERPQHIIETYHKGKLPRQFEGIRISMEHVIATVLKRAEGDDGWIVRCYETAGRACAAAIEIPLLARAWSAEFGKCEIKTFFVPDSPEWKVTERNLIEL